MKKLLCSALFALTLVSFGAQANAASRIEYILDVSGSMNAMAGGETRMAAAKKAIGEAVQGIPEGSIVALRLYAHRIPPGDKAGSCKDTELVIPFGPINKSQFLATVNATNPLGQTPIAYSLEQAANDFTAGADEAQTIILVSDGEESCGGDPVGVAKALIARGFKIKINVIGLEVDANAKNQLSSIASVTGGQYFDARDAAGLSSSLQKLTQESLVIQKAGSSVYGDEIRGGDNYETAVPLPTGKLFRLNHHQRQNQYDYFYVEAKAGQRIVASLETGEKGVNIKPDNTYDENLAPYAGISLQSPQKTQLEQAQIIGGKNDSKQLVYAVPSNAPGRYYVLIGSSYDHQHKDHRFKVEITDQYDAGTQQDAGDTRDTALAIQPGTIKGFLTPNDTVDTFKVPLPAGNLNIRARPTSEKTRLALHLFDADGVQLADGTSPNEGAVAKIENYPIAKPGEYILKLSAVYSNSDSAYTMEILPAGAAAPVADLGAPPAASPGVQAPPAPPTPPAPTTPLAPAPTVSADQPISKPVPMPGVPVAAAPQTSAGVCQMVKQLPLWQKVKFYAIYSGIPLVGGLLLGWIFGYFKGRGSGKRWAARQAVKQATHEPPAPK